MEKNLQLPIYLFHEGTNYESYKLFVPHTDKKDGDVWTFRVWAPHAKSVSVVGDFNGWDAEKNVCRAIAPGIWECVIEGLKDFDAYKYCITAANGKTVLKCDPYAAHAETAPANASKLYRSRHVWRDSKWMSARKNRDPYRSPMNIYEVHLGSWKRYDDGNFFDYRKLADELSAYCIEMGYTHVEILPVTEYPFDGSWGYQVTGMFAPTSRYGTPDDFRYFVDLMHRKGIGVILDWVVAHFPKDEHGLCDFDGQALYEYEDELKKEHKEWGTRVFDYGKKEVRSFLISSANYWAEEFHVDGIRMDAVASMLYLDYGRRGGEWRPNAFGGNYNLEAIDFIKQLNTEMLTRHEGLLMIAEESTAFPMVTKPAYDGGLGFNFKWNMGWMNDMLCYVSANPFFRKDMHDKVTFAITYAFSENYILPISHDEVVHGKHSLLDKMPGEYTEKFSAMKAFLGFMYAHPGKKLLFMGSEFGQFIEWDYKKQLDWFLLGYESHRRLHAFVKKLNEYYLAHPEMYDLDCSYDGFKWIVVDDNTQNIVSFVRYDEKGDYTIAVVNFSPIRRQSYCMGVPEMRQYEVALDSNAVEFGGDDAEAAVYDAEDGAMHGHEQFIRMDIPANSVIYLRPGKALKRKKRKVREEEQKPVKADKKASAPAKKAAKDAAPQKETKRKKAQK